MKNSQNIPEEADNYLHSLPQSSVTPSKQSVAA